MEILRLKDIALAPGVDLFWTTRRGGVSDSPYHSGNLSFAVGDDADAVRENRSRLQAALPHQPVWLRQVHGRRVVCADEVREDAPPEADASYTYAAGVVCAVQTADCVPVLFYHADGAGVGAAHAGWRGLAAGVLERLAATMQNAHSSPLAAVVGPCISAEHYVVGDDVRQQFGEEFAPAFTPAAKPNHWHADLPQISTRQLQQVGIATVHNQTLCTYANAQLFFSARRAGTANHPTGRQAALIYRHSPPA